MTDIAAGGRRVQGRTAVVEGRDFALFDDPAGSRLGLRASR
jgi:hypothetical protein